VTGYQIRGSVEVVNPWIEEPGDGHTMAPTAPVGGVAQVGHEVEMTLLVPATGAENTAGRVTVEDTGRWVFAGDQAMTVGVVQITATDVTEPLTSPHVITVTVVDDAPPGRRRAQRG
jgi:hypothetical protein